jgi:hypothetical protein
MEARSPVWYQPSASIAAAVASGGVVVAAHDQVPAGAQLARLPGRHRRAGGRVGDLDLGLRQRRAQRPGPVLGGGVGPDHGE